MRLVTLVCSFLILISAAVYSAYWFYAAGRAGTEIASWSQGPGPLGLTITTASTPQIQGFPFNFSVTLGSVTISDPARWGSAKIAVSKLASWCHPWSPHQWRFEALDGGSFAGQDSSADNVKLQSLEGEIQELSSEQGSLVSVNLVITRLDGLLGGAAYAASHVNLHLAAPETPPQSHTGESLTFAAVMDDVKLPNTVAPLGQMIGHISAVGAVDGSVPKTSLHDALDSWREGGGTVEVHHLTIDWGPLSLTGDGTLALDKDLQPIGAFSTSITNYSSIVDALITAGMIKATDGSYINIGLGLLAQKGEDGRSVLKAPLTLQNHNLFIGPAKLTRLPQIEWH